MISICVAGVGLLAMHFSFDFPDANNGASEIDTDIDKKITENREEIWEGNRAESSIQPGTADDSAYSGLKSPDGYINAEGEYSYYYDDIDTNLDYEEVIEIAHQQLEIQEFIEGIGDDMYEEYAWFDYEDTWFVDIYPLNYWDAFAYVTISDSTGNVLEIFTWNGEGLEITKDEIMEIVLEHSVVKEFIETYPDVESYCFYEFFGFWSVSFYYDSADDYGVESVDYNYDYGYESKYLYAVFDAVTEEIIEIYTSFAPSSLNLNIDSVMELVLLEPDMAEFVEDHPDYYIDTGVYLHYGEDQYAIWYLYFQTYPDAGARGGVTPPSAPTEDFDIVFWDYSFAFVSVDDATGEILYVEVYSWHEATRTEEEVLEIASTLTEIQEFQTVFPDTEITVYYDYYGTWFVSYYVPYLYDAWAYISIVDETGEVLYVEIYIPEQVPLMTYDEVLNVVKATPEAQNFTVYYPNATIYAYYCFYEGYKDENTSELNGGYWYGELSNMNNNFQGYTDPDTGESLDDFNTIYEAWCFEIDDTTGEIIEMVYYINSWWDNEWEEEWVDPTMTQDEVLEIASALPEIKDFQEQILDAEIYVYYDFYSGTWWIEYHSLSTPETWASVVIDDATGKVLEISIGNSISF